MSKSNSTYIPPAGTSSSNYAVNSAASTPAIQATGTIYTGGTGTTTTPHWLIQPTGTPSGTWSTNGTAFGVNIPSSISGNLLDLQFGGVSKFSIGTNALVTAVVGLFSGDFTTTGQIKNGSTYTTKFYRTTNGGSDVTPKLFVGTPETNTAGTLALAFDTTNGLSFTAGNNGRHIARASIGIGNLTNTSNAESGDLMFYTQTSGSAMSNKMTLSGTGNLTIGAATNIVGTTTNNNAATGNIGEHISSAVSIASGISNNTTTNVTSISLTAGDWDVEGNVNFSSISATITAMSAGVTSTSATIPSDGTEVNSGVQVTTTSINNSITLPRKRFSLSGTTTIYLVGKATFSAGTMTAYGSISARRVR